MLVNKRQGSQKEPAAGEIHWLFQVNSPPTVLWKEKKETPKSQNLMMSVHSFSLDPLVTRTFSTPKLCPCCNFFPSPPTPKLLPPT